MTRITFSEVQSLYNRMTEYSKLNGVKAQDIYAIKRDNWIISDIDWDALEVEGKAPERKSV